VTSTILVTGVSGGIGRATALALATRGAHVVGVARDPGRGRAAVAEIRGRVPGAAVDLLVADLGSLDAVRRLAAEVAARYDPLDALLNNAGVAMWRRETTVDGYERTFAVNHLAPYLLTRLLLDRLAPGGRVVTVASEVHRQVRRIPWDDLQAARRYSAFGAYNLSKLANVLFTRALAARLDPAVATATAVSPGFVHTGLNRGAPFPYSLFFLLTRPFQAKPAAGARTPVWALTAAQARSLTGDYLEDCKPGRTTGLARDRDQAERLWTVSAELCGLAP
jgi:retinol dehydrogenase 12